MPLTDTERDAAAGQLPSWSKAGSKRREHMSRVAALLERWADELDLNPAEKARWVAAGWLHDALREEDPEVLRGEVEPALADLPGPILHGPAAAARLAGSVDDHLALAIRYHTIGHPSLDRLGRALYLADFLEPGRDFREEWRAELRNRVKDDLEGVLQEVVAARIEHLLERGKPIRPETAAFWSQIVTEGK